MDYTVGVCCAQDRSAAGDIAPDDRAGGRANARRYDPAVAATDLAAEQAAGDRADRLPDPDAARIAGAVVRIGLAVRSLVVLRRSIVVNRVGLAHHDALDHRLAYDNPLAHHDRPFFHDAIDLPHFDALLDDDFVVIVFDIDHAVAVAPLAIAVSVPGQRAAGQGCSDDADHQFSVQHDMHLLREIDGCNLNRTRNAVL